MLVHYNSMQNELVGLIQMAAEKRREVVNRMADARVYHYLVHYGIVPVRGEGKSMKRRTALLAKLEEVNAS